MIHITKHALKRYQERCADVSDEEARLAMSSRAVHIAADFAGLSQCFVRLASGVRIAVRDNAVITVLPSDRHKRAR